MAKLLFLDGNSLTYRAYHAIPEHMSNRAGEVTNAVFGFTAMLMTLIRDQRPDGVAVCFDRREPTFRHLRKPSYKAQRDRTPDDLIRQMGVVRRLLEVLRIPAVDLAGFEADDLLATLAHAAQQNGDDVVVVSGDRDTFQLPKDPHVKVLYTLRGVTKYALLDEAGVIDRVGVHPTLYTQYAAMRGDKSDNLPGVPRVGEKTAAQLLNEYGDLDGIFAHIDQLSPKLRQNMADYEELVRENLKLMVLRYDVPIDTAVVDVANLCWQPIDGAALKTLFGELEFREMYDKLTAAAVGTPLEGLVGAVAGGAGVPQRQSLTVAAQVPKSPAAAVEALNSLNPAEAVALNPAESVAVNPAESVASGQTGVAVGFTLEGTGALGAPDVLTGLAVVLDADAGSVLCLDAELLGDKAVTDALRPIFEAVEPTFDAHRSKQLMTALSELGIGFQGLRLDVGVAAYLVDSADGKCELAELLNRHTDLELPQLNEPVQGSLDVGEASVEPLAVQALAVHHLVPVLTQTLDELGMTQLYSEVERPMIGVLARMERRGIGVDAAELKAFSKELEIEAVGLAEKIIELAGHEFNINSPKEIGVVLFDEMNLTPGKRTQRGDHSTNAATLEAIRTEHEIVNLVLSYRETAKLRSTCEKTLLASIAPDGRIHAVFHQTVARTGRLISEGPNLHAIPVRGDHGLRVRRAFVPRDAFELLVADYDQIELRVVAHLSQDPGLIEMFATSVDVHSATAAAVFGVEPGDVTAEMRYKAKMVSYGLIYGMEGFGLGQRLGIETGEANQIVEAYFNAFGGVRDFMTRVVNETSERGYTETMFGRRRLIPELRAKNPHIRRSAQRQAMNAPVQGLAADIFKIALVHLDEALEAQGAASSLILQVHDEVVLELAPDERDQVRELTVATMSNAVELSVPLEVAVGIGASWADTKK